MKVEDNSKQYPYKSLGTSLRSLREKEHESIPDVSGAVEIDSEVLVEIEKGLKLPSEDILLLLISHFSLQNEEAMKLWKLAGYDNLVDNNQSVNLNNFGNQPAVFILPIDSRVVYTDKVQANVNNFGIVVNFQQNNAQQNSQPLTVARVGMSREYAEHLVALLQKLLFSKESTQDQQKLIKQQDTKGKNQKNKKQV